MKKLLYIFFALTIVTKANAQLDLGLILEAGAADTEQYIENYFAPAVLGFGYAMNGSWYNTAKPHKLLGFDLTISGTAAYVPEIDQTWRFRNADFNNMELVSGTEADVPTLYGPNTDPDELPELRFVDPDTGDELLRMSAITGLGLAETELPVISENVAPAPMFQIGLGLVKNTEIKFRFVPNRDYTDEVTSGLLGIGVMHDFAQWIPGLSSLPIDLAAFYGFTSLTTDYKIDPDLGQTLSVSTNSNTFQVLASKKLSVLTVYSGIGFSNAKANIDMTGDYEVGDNTILTDPISMEQSGGTFRGSLGARLKLLIFTFHAEYVLQKYNLFSAGFGISVR